MWLLVEDLDCFVVRVPSTPVGAVAMWQLAKRTTGLSDLIAGIEQASRFVEVSFTDGLDRRACR